jgi:hypothetical protein
MGEKIVNLWGHRQRHSWGTLVTLQVWIQQVCQVKLGRALAARNAIMYLASCLIEILPEVIARSVSRPAQSRSTAQLDAWELFVAKSWERRVLACAVTMST